MNVADRIARYYDENYSRLAKRYSTLKFIDVHGNLIERLPPLPARILDVGAGVGRDAIGLHGLGYSVTACEPSIKLLSIAKSKCINADIVWMNDKLPGLSEVIKLGWLYDVILVSAVWMHLSKHDRMQSLSTMKDILISNGFVYITYRSKSVDPNDLYFDLSVDTFKDEVCSAGLEVREEFTSQDIEGRSAVEWFSFVVVHANAR